MTVKLSLFGTTLEWRLVNVTSLQQWFAERPWEREGGVQPVHVPERLSGEVLASLRRSFYGGSEGLVRWAEIAVTQPELPATLSAWAGIQAGSLRELAASLVKLTELADRLFVCTMPDVSVAASWIADATRLVELAGKLRPSAPLAFLLLGSGNPRDTRFGPRLDLGWPVRSTSTRDERARWAHYLHERAAWHAGGELDLAVELDEPSLGFGDDAGFEARLDAHARRRFAALDDATRTALARSTTAIARAPELQLSPEIGEQLGTRQAPQPWLARALVLEHPEHPERRRLRALVTCQPLAQRLLVHCMALEARVKDKLLVTAPSVDPKPEIVGHFHRLADPSSLEHKLQPPNTPLPKSAWDLVGLGELLNAGISVRARGDIDELRRLRNALAHASPVGWRALELVERLDARLP